MARSSDLLRRFRLMAVPGEAGIAGVPADHASLLREELAPVFAALHDAQERVNDIVARADAEAVARRERGVVEARRIVNQARDAQPATRTRSAARVEAEAVSSTEEIRAGAHHEIERIDDQKSERIGPVVDELVRRVLSTGGPSEAPS